MNKPGSPLAFCMRVHHTIHCYFRSPSLSTAASPPLLAEAPPCSCLLLTNIFAPSLRLSVVRSINPCRYSHNRKRKQKCKCPFEYVFTMTLQYHFWLSWNHLEVYHGACKEAFCKLKFVICKQGKLPCSKIFSLFQRNHNHNRIIINKVTLINCTVPSTKQFLQYSKLHSASS